MRYWLTVAGVALATVALKGAGPLLFGGRSMPPRVRGVLGLLAPALLAALVVTQTFTDSDRLVFDARAAGVAAAGVALLLRAPLLVVVAVAALVTALLRVATG